MSQVQVIFNDFMSVAVFFYHSVGVDPYDPIDGKSKSSRWFYPSFIISVSNLLFVNGLGCAFVWLAFKNNDNFVEATMMLSCVGYSIVAESKMLAVWRQKPKLSEFMRKLDSIFPTKEESEQNKYRVESYLLRSRLTMRVIGGLYLMLVATFNSYPLAAFVIERWILHNPEAEKDVPYVPTAPWNWHDNWGKYILLYLIEAIAGYTATAGHISSDLLIYSVTTQVIMHFDYLSRTLEEYKVQARRAADGYARDLKFLQGIIIYHNKLLSLTDVMNEVFGVALLLNFLTSSVLVCFIGFVMTVGVDAEMKFKSALFFCSCMAEIYLMCNFSQQLLDASAGLTAGVYNMDWTEADPRFCKMLILLAQRGQRPVSLKATVFLDISMGTMTDFMQMSYKFFAMVRTMYSD